jgi:hypothetical protein
MIDDLGREQREGDRQFANWRVVIAAWAVVVIFFLLFTGATAVACLRHGLHQDNHQKLAGAVIPRHDACVGPGIASAAGANGCENLPVYEDRSAYW